MKIICELCGSKTIPETIKPDITPKEEVQVFRCIKCSWTYTEDIKSKEQN